MIAYYKKVQLICPGELEEVAFWTKKWRITVDQLHDAIIETGSINIKELKEHLIQKGVLFSFSRQININKYFIQK